MYFLHYIISVIIVWLYFKNEAILVYVWLLQKTFGDFYSDYIDNAEKIKTKIHFLTGFTQEHRHTVGQYGHVWAPSLIYPDLYACPQISAKSFLGGAPYWKEKTNEA